jgi:hypothetical protein
MMFRITPLCTLKIVDFFFHTFLNFSFEYILYNTGNGQSLKLWPNNFFGLKTVFFMISPHQKISCIMSPKFEEKNCTHNNVVNDGIAHLYQLTSRQKSSSPFYVKLRNKNKL